MQHAVLLIALFLFSLPVRSQFFDTLLQTPQPERVKLARHLYKKQFRKTDSVTTFKGFEQLFALAHQLKDRSLECSIHELQADYFSVNRGFNSYSPDFYQQAIDLAIHYELPVDVAVYTHKKATYYNTFKRYPEAYRYFMEAYTLFETAGFENVPEIGSLLHTQATFHFYIGDVEAAQRILLEAIKYKIPTAGERISITNTLALTYQKSGDEQKALNYFDDGLRKAIALGDTAWIGIISGNVGALYFEQKKYSEAIPRLAIDYQYSLKTGEKRSATSALLTLVRCYLFQNNIPAAIQLAKDSHALVKEVDDLGLWIVYYDNMALIHEGKEEPLVALNYRKQYTVAKDSLAKINNQSAINRVQLKWEMEKHTAEVQKLRAEARMEVLKRNSLVAALLLLMVIAVLVYNRQLLKVRKEKELSDKQEALLKVEKARAEEELGNASRALERYTENLKEKNELIEEFKAEIDYLHLQLGEPHDREKVAHLEKLMQAHIMTDETWDEFKKLFDKVYAGFLHRSREKFIQATETDIRLLTLIRLGLGNREMANMLGVTTEAIKKARQRLRKKINLPEHLTLEEVVTTI